MDDTLVATWNAKCAHNIYVAKTEFGIDLDEKTVLEHYGKALLEIRRILFRCNDAMRVTELARKHEAKFPKQLLEGSADVIKTFSDKEYLTGLVTAIDRFQLDDEIESYGLDGLFSYTQTCDDTDFHKPDPCVFDPVLEFAKSKKIEPEQILFVGDGLVDALAASGAGLQFVGVATGPKMTIADFEKEGFAAIDSVVDLPRYLGLE